MNLSRSKINALLALALFTFAFLAAEFRFDVNVGLLAGAERVVLAQGFILGASVIGFIGYAPLLGLAQRKGQPQAVVSAAVPIAILGLTQIQSPTGSLALEILGCLAFIGLGLLGAATHYAFSLAFQDDPKLATGAGAAYAAGILMQFAINLLNCGGIAELIVLGTVTIAISALSAVPLKAAESPNPTVNPFAEPSHALAKQACWSIALVMILACLFSTLDNVVTLSNAHGTIAVQTWPRLFLAASGLAAGLIFDLAERRYMGLIMLGVTALSTISILAVEAGADPNLGLVVFYLSSAFCHVLYRHVYAAGAAHAYARTVGWHGPRSQQRMCVHHVGHLAGTCDLGQCRPHHDRRAHAACGGECGVCSRGPVPPTPNRAGARTPATSRESTRRPHHRGATPGLHRQPRSHPARSRRAHSRDPG